MATAQTRAAMPPDGIDLVDKDDARGTLLTLLKQVPDAAGTHAHEHLDEVGAGNREKRHVGLARHSAR